MVSEVVAVVVRVFSVEGVNDGHDGELDRVGESDPESLHGARRLRRRGQRFLFALGSASDCCRRWWTGFSLSLSLDLLHSILEAAWGNWLSSFWRRIFRRNVFFFVAFCLIREKAVVNLASHLGNETEILLLREERESDQESRKLAGFPSLN